MKPVVWDKNEELNFLQEIASGKSMDNIAKDHDRSASALDLRLKKIIFDNITAGKKEESMAKLLNMPQDKVKQYFYEYKGFLEKKGKLNDTVNEVKTNVDQPVINNDKQSIIANPPKQTLIITNPSNPETNIINKPVIKPSNIVLTGGKDVKKTISDNNMSAASKKSISDNTLMSKLMDKNKKIEMENNYMKNVLDNINMRKQINKLIEKGILDKKIKKIFKLTKA